MEAGCSIFPLGCWFVGRLAGSERSILASTKIATAHWFDAQTCRFAQFQVEPVRSISVNWDAIAVAVPVLSILTFNKKSEAYSSPTLRAVYNFRCRFSYLWSTPRPSRPSRPVWSRSWPCCTPTWGCWSTCTRRSPARTWGRGWAGWWGRSSTCSCRRRGLKSRTDGRIVSLWRTCRCWRGRRPNHRPARSGRKGRWKTWKKWTLIS